MTTTRTRPGYYTRPRKPIEPITPVTGCNECDNGCHCDGSPERPGCEHWGCWGRSGTNDCAIGADAHRAHMNASIQYRRDLHAYFVSGGI